MTSLFGDIRQNEALADAILNDLFCNPYQKTTYHYQEIYRLYRAKFIKYDTAFLSSFRTKLKDKLSRLCVELNTANRTSSPQLSQLPPPKLSAVLAYSLCLLSHAGIKPSDPPFDIPIFNDKTGSWEMKPYRVELIELTPTSGWEAFAMTHHDRVFAYGLIPEPLLNSEQEKPNPILIFPGKPIFTWQGFTTWWFDQFRWPLTPGSWLLYTGKSRLLEWLKTNARVTKTLVYGLAAGGDLATELFFDKEIKPFITEIIAYDPDKLYRSHPKNPDQSATNMVNPSVLVMTTQSSLAESPPQIFLPHMSSAQLLRLRPEIPSQWSPARRCYAAQPNFTTEDLNETTSTISQHPYWYMRLLATELLEGLAFALFILPCRFLIFPTIRAILAHKTEALVLSLLVFAFIVLPGFCVTPLGIAGAVAASLYLLYKLTPPLERLVGLKPAMDANADIEGVSYAL